jgi:hypothetical protein
VIRYAEPLGVLWRFGRRLTEMAVSGSTSSKAFTCWNAAAKTFRTYQEKPFVYEHKYYQTYDWLLWPRTGRKQGSRGDRGQIASTPLMAMGRRRTLQDWLIPGVKIIASAVQPNQYPGHRSPLIPQRCSESGSKKSWLVVFAKDSLLSERLFVRLLKPLYVAYFENSISWYCNSIWISWISKG